MNGFKILCTTERNEHRFVLAEAGMIYSPINVTGLQWAVRIE